jgi:predicted permease
MLRNELFSRFLQDLRYGIRTLISNPMFVVIPVLSLAFGIGVNLLIYSVFRSVLLKDITAVEPSHLVSIRVGGRDVVSYPNYHDIENSRIFAGLAAHTNNGRSTVNWQFHGESRQLYAQYVTANFFGVLGVKAAYGRLFTLSDAQYETGATPVVLGYQLWTHYLNQDQSVLGSTLDLNGWPYTVVGILPEDYRSVAGLAITPDVYLPVSPRLLPELLDRSGTILEMVGRLPDNKTQEQVRDELVPVLKQLEDIYPKENHGLGVVPKLYRLSGIDWLKQADSKFGGLPVLEFFTMLLFVVGLILLLACANVACLLLVRGAHRSREFAVRMALGASRRRLLQQLFTENLVVPLAGMALGLLLNFWVGTYLNRMEFPILSLPIRFNVNVDGNLLVYGFFLAILSAVLSGLSPAWQSTRLSVQSALKHNEAFINRRLTLRNSLVVLQVGFSFVLLITTFLFLQSMIKMSATDPGFEVNHIVVSDIQLVDGRYNSQQFAVFLDELVGRAVTIPGVKSVSYASFAPLSRMDWDTDVRMQNALPTDVFRVHMQAASVGYFQTMNIPVLRGRDFTPADKAGAPRAIIINQTFAARHFRGQDPIGQALFAGTKGTTPLTIVGIVPDTKYRTLGEEPVDLMYQPYLQSALLYGGGDFSLLMKINGQPESVITPLVHIVNQLDPTAAVDSKSLSQNLSAGLLPSRIAVVLLGCLAALGLILSMIGLYSVMNFAVSRRTAEIGIRMALGASRNNVMKMILSDGLTLVSIGIAIGVAGSILLNRKLTTLLAYGVGTWSPFVFVGVAAVLMAVSILAIIVPARRAIRIDPLRALRYE